ncbi:unnamed protein product [Closterium sp. NIES-65]|nr:unnamed protein product [Closterium sp. NIES-65]
MRSAGSAGKGGRAKSNWPDTPNAFQTIAPRKRDEARVVLTAFAATAAPAVAAPARCFPGYSRQPVCTPLIPLPQPNPALPHAPLSPSALPWTSFLAPVSPTFRLPPLAPPLVPALSPFLPAQPSPFSPWLARALLFLPGLATGFILGRLLGGSGGSGKAAGGKKGELTAGGGGSSSGRKGGGGSAGGRSAPAFGGKAETEGAGGLVVGRGSELKMVLVVRQDLKMSSGKIAAQCALDSKMVAGRGSELKVVLVVRQDSQMRVGKIAAQCAPLNPQTHNPSTHDPSFSSPSCHPLLTSPPHIPSSHPPLTSPPHIPPSHPLLTSPLTYFLPDAAVGILTDLQTSNKALLRHYEACGQPKIVVSCSNLKEMNELRGKAQQHRLPVFTVCDAGRTQVAAGSKAVLAVAAGSKTVAAGSKTVLAVGPAPPPSPRLLPHHTSSLTTPPPLPRLLPYHASSLTTPPPLPRLLPYHAPNLQPPFNPPSEFPPSLAPPHRNSPFTEPFTALLPV